MIALGHNLVGCVVEVDGDGLAFHPQPYQVGLVQVVLRKWMVMASPSTHSLTR